VHVVPDTDPNAFATGRGPGHSSIAVTRGLLDALDAAEAPTPTIHRGSAHLCIADPLGRAVNLREGFWSDLFASHPPMRLRIEALRAMALQGPPA
jgi:Zn-dependent protease with chaperone function